MISDDHPGKNHSLSKYTKPTLLLNACFDSYKSLALYELCDKLCESLCFIVSG